MLMAKLSEKKSKNDQWSEIVLGFRTQRIMSTRSRGQSFGSVQQQQQKIWKLKEIKKQFKRKVGSIASLLASGTVPYSLGMRYCDKCSVFRRILIILFPQSYKIDYLKLVI